MVCLQTHLRGPQRDPVTAFRCDNKLNSVSCLRFLKPRSHSFPYGGVGPGLLLVSVEVRVRGEQWFLPPRWASFEGLARGFWEMKRHQLSRKVRPALGLPPRLLFYILHFTGCFQSPGVECVCACMKKKEKLTRTLFSL